MPVVACPKCATNLRTPDVSAAAVRCPKCKTVFTPVAPPAFEVVDASPPPPPKPAPKPAAPEPEFDVLDDEPAPRKRRSRDDDDDDRPRGKGRRGRRREYDNDDYGTADRGSPFLAYRHQLRTATGRIPPAGW